jgi:HSP20 family protein
MAETDITKTPAIGPHRGTDIFSAMRDEMDRVFQRFEVGVPRWPLLPRLHSGDWMVPQLDVRESDKLVAIDIDLPGVDENNVTVSIANGRLTIKGEKKSEHEEKEGDCYLAERSYGTFERSVQLPDSVDDSKLEAKFDKGVLKIVAQKRPGAAKAERKIEIKKN